MTQASIEVRTSVPYRVVVGPGVLGDALAASAEHARRAVVTDANVARLYGATFASLPTCVVEPGEPSKSFAVLERTLEALARADLDRDSAVIALGGGVVGDLAGLAASLYMRGIAVVHCPTTLLAQVDSSVGGKTAVNLAAGKNLAGTFHQPRAVFADTSTLATLPGDELLSGLGEAVKCAVLGDPELFALLESSPVAVLERDAAVLTRVVERCVRVKAGIVERDEREGGERKKLNLGHTFAHAIEQVAGYGRIPHGVAVAAGLALAARASQSLGLLEDDDLVERLDRLLASLGLPGGLDEVRTAYGHPLAVPDLVLGLRHDKKGRAGEPRLVVPRGVGSIALDVAAEPGLLIELLA